MTVIVRTIVLFIPLLFIGLAHARTLDLEKTVVSVTRYPLDPFSKNEPIMEGGVVPQKEGIYGIDLPDSLSKEWACTLNQESVTKAGTSFELRCETSGGQDAVVYGGCQKNKEAMFGDSQIERSLDRANKFMLSIGSSNDKPLPNYRRNVMVQVSCFYR